MQRLISLYDRFNVCIHANRCLKTESSLSVDMHA